MQRSTHEKSLRRDRLRRFWMLSEAPGELSSKSPRLPGSYLNPFSLGIADPRKHPGFKVGNVHRHGMYRTSNFQLQWIQGVNDCTKILR